MINVDYICRCGMKSRSLFEQKRHVKYWCTMKHIPAKPTGIGIRIIRQANSKDARC